ncbi:putative MO25-like protein At5g47540 [Lactuca sativa]|uniref:putative MO25-like protein At5g47540 n=1 Tax=Lactuca sativa TaxID=4236 RepID=UPI001C68E555|nr:putative MO25-like protein At5g47540 [Lactuca sativa]
MLCLSTLGKTLINTKKLQTPTEVVHKTRSLLLYSKNYPNAASQVSSNANELNSLVKELKLILYGDDDSEPCEQACAQLTEEFFREDTMRLLIIFLPKLNLEARKDATQVVASLQRQPLPSRFQASKYLESNLDLVDILISGYADPLLALHYGRMLKECLRHQVVASYILEPIQLKKLFGYIQLPSFDISADVADVFKDLLTRHKSTVSESLSKNYSWFFTEYNEKLLKSSNYITKRQAIKLLGSILLDRSNSAFMRRYVSSKDNLIILMNLLRDTSRSIQIDAFHVFKLFVANEEKPIEIVSILITNRNKLLRLLGAFVYTDDQVFETDKDQVVNELTLLEI